MGPQLKHEADSDDPSEDRPLYISPTFLTHSSIENNATIHLLLSYTTTSEFKYNTTTQQEEPPNVKRGRSS